MRPSSWLFLTALFLLAVGYQASRAINPAPPPPVQGPPAVAPKVASKAPKAPIQLLIKEEITGYGKTTKDAEAHVLEQARDWFAEHGDFGWTPSADYLRQKGLVHFGEPTETDLERAGHVYVLKARLEVNSSQAEEMRAVARDQRKVSRHLLVARVLAGLLGLVLVAGGYLRLEEATRGYYTTLLRMAAVAVLALVGVGLWILQ